MRIILRSLIRVPQPVRLTPIFDPFQIRFVPCQMRFVPRFGSSHIRFVSFKYASFIYVSFSFQFHFSAPELPPWAKPVP